MHRIAGLDEGHLRRAVPLGLYLVATLLLAYWVGTQQVSLLYISLVLVVFLILILTLQQEVWVLILLGWSLSSGTGMFALPLSMRDISVVLTACAYVAFRALSFRQMQMKWQALDVILGLNVVYLAFTYMLNPVGLRAFGAETIGGRPYFTIALAVVGYWVIWRLPGSVKTVSRIPLFILAGSLAATSLYGLAYFIPSLPSRIPYLYMALNVEAYFVQAGQQEFIVRYKELGAFGGILLVTLYAYFPFVRFLNPLRLPFYALVMGLICVLVSGFRSALGTTVVVFGISNWLHGRVAKFVMGALVGGGLLLGIALGHGRLYDLPQSVQRSLSFLPGQWSAEVRQDVEWSSEGRFRWWRDVFQYRLIKNWWFGDGFGANEMEVALASRGGAQEMAKVTGALHSGPLTALRYVGIVGLVLFYVLVIAAGVSAYRCVQKCRGTILQPVTIYLAAQLIWHPIGYTFIFGAYNVDMPQVVFLCALLRLVWRMAEDDRTPQGGVIDQTLTSPTILAR